MRSRHTLSGLLFAVLLPAQNAPQCQRPPELDKVLKAQPSARAFNALGAYFAQHQQIACAIPAFGAALKLDPASWEAHYNLALALLEKGDVSRAAKELQIVVKQQPSMPDAHNALGTANLRLGQAQTAEAEFKAAVKADPRNAFALQQLTEILIEQGRYSAAITYLIHAPDDPVLQNNLAIAYAKNGKPEEAVAILKRLVQAQPDSAVAHFNLGTEQAHQKLYRSSVEEYQEAIRLDPSNDLARTSLVKALNILAQYGEALPIIEDYARRKPDDFESPYLLGEVYRGLGRYSEAIPQLQRAVKMRPENYDAQYNLGFVLAKEGRYKEAQECLDRALKVRPEASEARYQLGVVLRALHQTERSKEEFARFDQQRRQTGKKDTAAVVGGRANQYLMSGDAPQAVEAYRESLKEDPDNPRIYYNLALALDRLGDQAGERDALERAVRLDASLSLAQNQLGLLDLQDGKLAAAEERFNKALSLDPQFAEAQSNLGVLYGQQGRVAEAETLFRQATENNPNYAQAFMNLGLILAGQNKLAEAEKEIATAVRLAPNMTRALTSLGMVQSRSGRQSEAVENFRKVITLDPKSPEAHVNLGIALADSYNLVGALAEFSEAVSMGPQDPVARYNKGRALFDLKRYEEARTELEQATSLAPRYFEPFYLLGLAEKQLGNDARSADVLRKAVALDANEADAQFFLGRALSRIDRVDEAIAHWKRAVQINPDHGEALYNLSRALRDTAPLEAQEYSGRLVELKKRSMVTDQAGTLSNFALVSIGAHDYQQAVSQLKEAIDVCGECSRRGELHKNLGLIYCRSGDIENGGQELRIAQKLLPGDADIQKSLNIVQTLKMQAVVETRK